MATYPGGVWAGNTRGTNLSDAQTHTTWHDDAMAEAIAIESELGTNPSQSFATVTAEMAFIVPLGTSGVNTWTTPFSSGVTTTTGTFTRAVYWQVGRVVFCELDFVFGASSAITADVILSLPVTAGGIHGLNGYVLLSDNSAGTFFQGCLIPSTTSAVALRRWRQSGTDDVTSQTLSSIIPYTWAANDRIIANLNYLT